MSRIEKKKVINVSVSACNYRSVINAAILALRQNKKLLIFPLATHTLVESLFDKKLKRVLDQYNILTPDSWWIVKSLNWIYGANISERVYGPTLMKKLLSKLNTMKVPIYFYGTNTETLNTLVQQIRKIYKRVMIGGSSPAPYGAITRQEIGRVVSEIQKSKSKIVFISLSSPKQVILAYRIAQANDKNCIYIPVGAAFDFLAKTKKQAPLWMQHNGLEWLFRLSHEPRRLFWRYIKTGIPYLILTAWQKVMQKK